MFKEGIRCCHLDVAIQHPPSWHRAYLKYLGGQGERLAISTCAQQAALAPLPANTHLHPYPGPALAPLQLFPGQNLSIKQDNPSEAVRVGNRCPKSRKSGCSCFVIQTSHDEFYYMLNITLLQWRLPGHRRQPRATAQGFCFRYLGTRLLSPGILIRWVWFPFF